MYFLFSHCTHIHTGCSSFHPSCNWCDATGCKGCSNDMCLDPVSKTCVTCCPYGQSALGPIMAPACYPCPSGQFAPGGAGKHFRCQECPIGCGVDTVIGDYVVSTERKCEGIFRTRDMATALGMTYPQAIAFRCAANSRCNFDLNTSRTTYVIIPFSASLETYYDPSMAFCSSELPGSMVSS